MEQSNFGDDVHGLGLPAGLRDGAPLDEPPGYPWLALFLIADIVAVIAIIWYVVTR